MGPARAAPALHRLLQLAAERWKRYVTDILLLLPLVPLAETTVDHRTLSL